MRFGGTVINADSMQVYRELRILTARPSLADERRAPHRLYGVLSAAEACSAARWRDLAVAEISDAGMQGRVPVLCGGTGLYLKALTEGLSPMPDVPAAVRRRVRDASDGLEASAVHRLLREKDPAMARRLSPTDRQRMLRALEVVEAMGRSLDSWQKEPPDAPPPGLRFHTILLDPPRGQLYPACEARFRAMADAGALDEVRALQALGLAPELPAMKALGVSHFLAHLDGRCDLETAIAGAQQATRNYAKRQKTWFRHQIIAHIKHNTQYSEKFGDEIFANILKNWLTPQC